MSSPAPHPSAVSNEFRTAFERFAGERRVLRFDEFVELALFDNEVGYYRSHRTRIGRSAGTDFFTAMSANPVFGHLVAAAIVSLLGKFDPASMTFVEIGAEPGRSVFENIPHPFRSAKTLRVKDPLLIEGPSVVFSNELLDAQPFRRFRRSEDQWIELGVQITDGGLIETCLGPASESWLPLAAEDGYLFDAPRRAADLALDIARQDWVGLFVAIDYGKSLEELTQALPGGTARAYRSHRQSNDLLATPGEQDLTCHVCWDWIAESLKMHRFLSPRIESQEAFFVHHAGAALEKIAGTDSTLRSTAKQALMQLLHPANMGQKFQVLHALRTRQERPCTAGPLLV
ncbi:MAG: SAM-dependent methyltransferase [Opitutaceae bacterium]|nr:SAM-dependent methyltransferase [Opitutaceae bacterium]